MGCVNTKKQTKDEDDNKPIERKEEKEEKKDEEPAPETNGSVEKAVDAEGDATTADVQVTIDESGEKSEGDADLTAFREEALRIHNRQRELHGVPEMTLNDDLNASAQKWAEHIAKSGALQHTPGGEREINGEMFGENLAHKNFGSSDQAAVDAFNPSAEEFVMMWYDEVKKGYEYEKTDIQPGFGHFTQVVWKSSTQFGIGRVRVQEGDSVNVFVCGQYLAAGNFQGEFSDNVLPLKS